MTGSTEVMLVVGTRPQFIKSAPIIKEILAHHTRIKLSIVHSGQHYDREMSSIFFHELRMPEPVVNLRAGSGSQAKQTALIMKRLEEQMLRSRPDIVMAPGDTNTTLGTALAAAKLQIPVFHVEAGLRSGDLNMPEEVNRRLTDHCSSLLFAPTSTALRNLRKEGLGKFAFLTGDTMVDALRTALPFAERRKNALLNHLGVKEKMYALVTLHRPSNVDDDRLRRIFHGLRAVGRELKVVFPVHPRTRARLEKMHVELRSLQKERLLLIPPQGYIESLALLKSASCLLTDSGGMQKEAFLLHTPCVTLRSTTEWPETLVAGANRLVTDPTTISSELLRAQSMLASKPSRQSKDPFGNGHAATKIANLIERYIN